mmetsp:Transcript_123733/g.309275  ORF Transcript_123733/g.309275 Transcript_123733/m.309275 type:complete len:210 (-) Transcript_123733:1004-1633(-)
MYKLGSAKKTLRESSVDVKPITQKVIATMPSWIIPIFKTCQVVMILRSKKHKPLPESAHNASADIMIKIPVVWVPQTLSKMNGIFDKMVINMGIKSHADMKSPRGLELPWKTASIKLKRLDFDSCSSFATATSLLPRAGLVSGRKMSTLKKIVMPQEASKTKIMRQPRATATTPPNIGASVMAMVATIENNENNFVRSPSSSTQSRAIA